MRRLAALAATLCLVLASSGAHAQSTEPTEADRASALAHLQSGISAAQAGDWEAARAEFTEAYGFVPSTRVLMNLAGAQRHTGQLVEARVSYQRWLREATDRDAQFRPTIEQELASLEREIPQVVVTLHGAIPGDTVELDGAAITTGEAHPANPGDHVVVVRRGETELHSEPFTLAASDWHEVEVTLPGVDPTPDADPDGAAARHSLITEREHEEITSSPWFWVGVGGGAALVLGIVIGVAVAASSGGGSAPIPDMGTLGPFAL